MLRKTLGLAISLRESLCALLTQTCFRHTSLNKKRGALLDSSLFTPDAIRTHDLLLRRAILYLYWIFLVRIMQIAGRNCDEISYRSYALRQSVVTLLYLWANTIPVEGLSTRTKVSFVCYTAHRGVVHLMNPEKVLRQIVQGKKGIRFSDFIRLIEAFGFTLDRVSGSHHIFRNTVCHWRKENERLLYQHFL